MLKLTGKPSPMANQFKVEDFISLCGSELILVGGQAVNLWGERYVKQEPSIREFLPFTSRDADFYRRVRNFKLPSGWKRLAMPTKGRMRLVADVLSGPDEQTAEILRSVNGLSADEIEAHAIPIPYKGKPLYVLTPIALFQAKLANVCSLPQEARQDLKHLQLLVPVSKCFLQDLLRAAKSPERPAQVIRWIGQHVENVRQAVGKDLLPFTNEWQDFLPISEMSSHPSEAVVNLYKHLPREVC